jgi:hypothetical protein
MSTLYTQTNVALLCCVVSCSYVTVPTDRAATGTGKIAGFVMRIFTKQIVVDICCIELYLKLDEKCGKHTVEYTIQ